MTFNVIGTYENDKVYLFDNPVSVIDSKGLQAGDIVRIEQEYVRIYLDGNKIRSWFISSQVHEAYEERETDYQNTISDFEIGTGRRL